MHQQLGNANSAERADSPEVIANQIDNHNMLALSFTFTEAWRFSHPQSGLDAFWPCP